MTQISKSSLKIYVLRYITWDLRKKAIESGDISLMEIVLQFPMYHAWIPSIPPKVWLDDTCIIAAENGHLEFIKWAITQGCPFHLSNIMNAAYHGNRKDEIHSWILSIYELGKPYKNENDELLATTSTHPKIQLIISNQYNSNHLF